MDLTKPLTDQELDRLDRFLLDRIDEDAVDEGSDEGVLGISELDGFLTAIVSGPVTVMPSRWLPAVYGDFEPVWDDLDDFQTTVSLIYRHMNDLVFTLIQHPEEFEPLFLQSAPQHGSVLVVDDWCEGYMRGVALTLEAWRSAPSEIADLLEPIRAFTAESDWRAHDLADSKEFDRLRDAIAPNARAIHAHWLRLRETEHVSAAPFRRDIPRVGRNDPCPCGSGKKYKKCCGQ